VEWPDLVKAAGRRDVVRLADGRVGAIVYAPIPPDARWGTPARTEASKAVVMIGTKRVRVACEEITELVERGNLVRPVGEQCTGKRNYDKKGAKKARDQAQSNLGERLDVYRCPHCDYWHLGGGGR
jgi:hypothetical protein